MRHGVRLRSVERRSAGAGVHRPPGGDRHEAEGYEDWGAFLLDAGPESTPERPVSVPARAEAKLGHRVGLFPSAARGAQEKGYEGFVRGI